MDSSQPKSQVDEIDINEVFKKIGSFFNAIGMGIIRLLALLRNVPLKNKLLFAGLMLLGGVSGVIYSSLERTKFYESSMILSSDYLNKRIMDDAIEKLNLLADEKSPKALARTLNISDTLAENILKFSAKPFISESELIEVEVLKEQLKNSQDEKKNVKVIEEVVKRIEVENRHAFEITVRIRHHESTKAIQNAIVNFFHNNDYVSKRIEAQRNLLRTKKEKLKLESQKLDSLKRVIYANYRTMAEQSRQGSNNVILSDKSVTNPIDVYQQDLEINEQIQNIDRQLFLQPDFEVVVGLAQFNEPTSISRNKAILISMLIGFGLGYVLVGLKHFNAYLSHIE